MLLDTIGGQVMAAWIAAAGLPPTTTVRVVVDTGGMCAPHHYACVAETLTGWTCSDFVAGCFTVYVTHRHLAARRSLPFTLGHELGHIKLDRFYINRWSKLDASEQRERDRRADDFAWKVLRKLKIRH